MGGEGEESEVRRVMRVTALLLLLLLQLLSESRTIRRSGNPAFCPFTLSFTAETARRCWAGAAMFMIQDAKV